MKDKQFKDASQEGALLSGGYDQNAQGSEYGRRLFLKLLGGGVLGATAMASVIGDIERAEASTLEPLWNSALVLIGHSTADQSPSPIIECPLFYANGHFANAFDTLDLTDLPTTGKVKGTVTRLGDTIGFDFSSSIAAAVTQGSDGNLYIIVAGEGTVEEVTGFFSGFSRAIIRCKYKAAVDQNDNPLFIACVHCVLILVRK